MMRLPSQILLTILIFQYILILPPFSMSSFHLHLIFILFPNIIHFTQSEPPSTFSFPTSFIPTSSYNQNHNQQKWTPLPPLGHNSISNNLSPSPSPRRPPQNVGFTQPSSSCPQNVPHKNKKLVLDAYIGLATNPKVVEELFHPDYIQHNPSLPDGRDAVIRDPDPIQGVEFMKVATDGDLVWTLARLKIFNQSYIAADIFRVECGRIKEHWDVLQVEENRQKPVAGNQLY